MQNLWQLISVVCLFLFSTVPGWSCGIDSCTSLAALKKIYPKLKEKEVIYQAACEDWREHCKTQIQKPCQVSPAHIVVVDNVEYRLFGYTHGVESLQAGAYERFIRKAIFQELRLMSQQDKSMLPVEGIFTEENLSKDILQGVSSIPYGLVAETRDHWLFDEDAVKEQAFQALGAQAKKNSKQGPIHPWTRVLAMDGLAYINAPSPFPSPRSSEEAARKEKEENWDVPTTFSGDFDDVFLQRTNEAQLLESQDLDIQLGLQEELPSHLEMEYELADWLRQQKSFGGDDVAVSVDTSFERSLFMAGMLKGYVQQNGLRKVSFFMGGWHLKHLYQILLDDTAVNGTWPYQLGLDLAYKMNVKKRSKKRRIR